VKIQPWDGKIVVAGISGGNMAVARYYANGTTDYTFDGDGRQTVDFGANDDCRNWRFSRTARFSSSDDRTRFLVGHRRRFCRRAVECGRQPRPGFRRRYPNATGRS